MATPEIFANLFGRRRSIGISLSNTVSELSVVNKAKASVLLSYEELFITI